MKKSESGGMKRRESKISLSNTDSTPMQAMEAETVNCDLPNAAKSLFLLIDQFILV